MDIISNLYEINNMEPRVLPVIIIVSLVGAKLV